MPKHEKACQQVGRSFCHLSSSELDEYVRKARFRARVAVALLIASGVTYVLLIRPTM
jgi:hypothetical protein